MVKIECKTAYAYELKKDWVKDLLKGIFFFFYRIFMLNQLCHRQSVGNTCLKINFDIIIEFRHVSVRWHLHEFIFFNLDKTKGPKYHKVYILLYELIK